MAKDKNHIEPIKELSPAQMQAYAEGKLTRAEQYRVEKYLLDHPFEAEAMEGYVDNPATLNDLNALNNRLDKRINAKKDKDIIPLWRRVLPYAAVFLLLIISVVFTINYFQQEAAFAPIAIEIDDAIESTEKEKIINPPKAEKVDDREDESESNSMAQVQDYSSSEPKSQFDYKTESKKAQGAMPYRVPIAPVDNIFQSEVEVSEELSIQEDIGKQLQGKVAGVALNEDRLNTTKFIKPTESLVAKNEVPLYRKKSVIQTTITGQVIDMESGEALPGVNIMVKGSGNGTSTDLEGDFEIQAKPNDVLVASFIGMQSQEIIVDQERDIIISMNPDLAQLSEVVVTGYGAEKEADNTYISTKPELGFSAFKKYLKENLQYPEEAKAKGTEGRVKLKLTISASGKIADIEVIKSLGDGCDEAAIRLVKEGPKWQAAKKGGNNVVATKKITVRFKLD